MEKNEDTVKENDSHGEELEWMLSPTERQKSYKKYTEVKKMKKRISRVKWKGIMAIVLAVALCTGNLLLLSPKVSQAAEAPSITDMTEYNGELDSSTGIVLDGQKWRLTSQKDDNLEVAEDAQRGKVLAITRAADGATGVYDWGTRLISYPALGIEVQPGKTYKLTYDYKLVGEACSTIPRIGILMEDGTVQEIAIAGYQDAGRSTDETQAVWKRAEAQYTVTDGVKAIDVRLVIAGYKNEKLYFDNISLTETTTAKWEIGPGWKQDNAQDQLDVIDFEGRGKVLKYTRGPKNWAGAAGRYEGARLISGNIKVEPNATYILSTQYFEQMAAGNDAALSWIMYYSPVGGSSTTIGSFNDASRNSGNWETANLEFTVDANTTEIVLEFETYGYHQDYILFDNLSLTKKGSTVNLMEDYDAENYNPDGTGKDLLTNAKFAGLEGLHTQGWTSTGNITVNEENYNALVLAPGATLTSIVHAAQAGDKFQFNAAQNGGTFKIKYNGSTEEILENNQVIIIPEGTAQIQVIYKAGEEGSTINKARLTQITASFSGASLTLSGNIGVNFYMNLSGMTSDSHMKITLPNGKTEKLPVPEQATEHGYCFTAEVAAKEMTADIKVQMFLDDETPVTEEKTYTVKNYADEILKGSYSDETKDLVKAMLQYGSYAQAYFRSPVSGAEMPNKDLDALDLSTVTLDKETYGAEITKADALATVIGSNLIIESETTLKVHFNLKQDNLTIKADNKDAVMETKGETSIVVIDNISAGGLDKVHEITISDGTDTLVVKCSALTYVCSVLQHSEDEALINVAKTIYLYHVAAEAYAQSVQ